MLLAWAHRLRNVQATKTNTGFWEQKIASNKIRDEKNQVLLEQRGWRVIVVWECELKTRSMRETTLSGLVNEIWGM